MTEPYSHVREEDENMADLEARGLAAEAAQLRRSLAIAILDVNIGKPGPWSFDAVGASVVQGEWALLRVELLNRKSPRRDADVALHPDLEAVNGRLA